MYPKARNVARDRFIRAEAILDCGPGSIRIESALKAIKIIVRRRFAASARRNLLKAVNNCFDIV